MTSLARIAALLGFFGLLVLLVAWHAFLAPPQSFPRSLLLLILAGPLLFPLRGIIHGRPYTHAWTSFLALFYFALGVYEAAGTPTAPALAWTQIGLSLTLFVGALCFARLRGREERREHEDNLPSRHHLSPPGGQGRCE